MKIGIIGSGQVAQTLAGGFLAHGHDVAVGTRDPAKLRDWAAKKPRLVVESVREAAKSAEVIVLAVKGRAALPALEAAGAADLAGKTVIDATNPLAETPPDHGVMRFFTTLDESLMERSQREFPDAHFVKAFSSVGCGRMVNPSYPEGKPTMFICGNDQEAKKTVATILDQFGWETADMGGVEAARAIEPLCILWCLPGILHNEWTHAFKLLR
jgi:8-hydroxy-5-deazaflavin:NADPH oxidoreductase